MLTEPAIQNFVKNKILKFSVFAGAALILILGASTITLWIIKPELLIANTVPMAFSTALCFVFLGIGIVVSFFENKKMARIFVSLVVLIAALSFAANLMEYYVGANSFSEFIIQVLNISKPQEMVSTTAILMMINAAALLLNNCYRTQKYCLETAGSLALFSLGVSIVFLIGSILGFAEEYLWHQDSPSAISTILGVTILSSTITALSSYNAIKIKSDISYLLPYIILITGVIITLRVVFETYEVTQLANKTSNLPIVLLVIGWALSIIICLLTYYLRESQLARWRTKHSWSLLNAILEATADGIIAFTLSGSIVEYNKKFMQLFKLSEADLKDANRDKILHMATTVISNTDRLFKKMQEAMANPWLEVNEKLILIDGGVYEIFAKPQIIDDEVVGRVWCI